MKNYSDKLKDPRWQKKRLEIMQRDKFVCQCCMSKDKPLTVHHLVYKKNTEPWDYDDYFLITLCESCHDVYHGIYDQGIDPDIIYLIVNLRHTLMNKILTHRLSLISK